MYVKNGGRHFFLKIKKEGDNMVNSKKPKNTPKHDGSGKGVRANKGRGGCTTTKPTGKGRLLPPPCLVDLWRISPNGG